MTKRTHARIDWPAVAVALAERISHAALHPGAMHTAVADFQRAKKRHPRHPSRWAVAFSGGADSLALLLILWAEGPGRWGRDFVAFHFNHRLRGRAATADEKFCARVCAALGVKLIPGRWAEAPVKASEAEAREARFDFFRREMSRRKIRVLWLGHQQDDIAESMLMRLARGSGTAGLAAPRPAQPMPGGCWHLRPMLTLKKTDIVAELRAAGAVWCEDETNRGPDFFRNRVRNSVVPAWLAAAQRDALAGAARARELLEEDDAALDAWLKTLAPVTAAGRLNLRRLAGKPRAVWRRALHAWLLAQTGAGRLSRQAFDALLDAVMAGKPTRHSIGRDVFAVLRDGVLRLERVGMRKRNFQSRAN
jgi:tRNA(Ile)-lysidine synthase